MSPQYDVVVVGAGPVGLSLALGLCQAGKSVLVLEKKTALSKHSRAPVLWPRTLEVLSSLGVVKDFLSEGDVVSQFKFWDADVQPNAEILSLSFADLAAETAYPFLVILPQEKTEKILLRALQKYHLARVKFACEVTSLAQDKTGVEFTYQENGIAKTISARFGVGCDGAHSIVRTQLGFSLTGRTYSLRVALADIHFRGKHDYPFPRISTHKFPVIGVQIQPELWRLILPYSENENFNIDDRVRDAVKHVFAQSEFQTIWKSEFRLHQRLSTDFVRERVAIAGDAAHLNSPVGGQGMNAGIQDTEVLTKVLLTALAEDSGKPLQEYGKARKRSIKIGVNRFTDMLTRALTFGDGAHIKSVMKGAHQLFRSNYFRIRFLRKISMLK